MSTALAQALLAPRAIALVGASGDPAKNTARPQRYLRQHGYTGRIVPINPSRAELFGERAWPDIAAVPGAIDHAFVMVPAAEVERVVGACAARGIPLITVYSDGFAEAGPEGARQQARLVTLARAGGSRLIGPNSIGSIVPPNGVALSVNAVLELPQLAKGRLGLISHSGSLIGAILSRGQARGIGFSALLSVGNEADLSMGEIADLLVDDSNTDAILLFLETVRDAPHLALACRRAHAAGKPVIAYVLGQSALGRSLAATHTGALAGDAEAMTAWLDAQGIVRVDQFETLLEIAPLLRQGQAGGGRRVAVVTTTGGGAAMVVDRIDSATVEVVGPPPAVIDKLAALGIRIGNGPVTDLTLAGTRREVYAAVLDVFLESDHCDTVLAVAGSSAQFHPQHVVEPIAEADRRGKRLLAFAAPQADAALALFADAGVPAFRTPEACADALRGMGRWQPPSSAAPPAGDEVAAVQAATTLLEAIGTDACDEAQAREVFAALGVPQGEWRVVPAGDNGVGLSSRSTLDPPSDPFAASLSAPMLLPAAVKVLSPDILHKSDMGGVRLNCVTDADARAAISAVIAAAKSHMPAARIRGTLVQRMERGLGEVIVGYRLDPRIGPTVVVGAGGTLAEVYRDAVVRPAPVSLDDAAQMIAGVRGLEPLRGYRGAEPGDLDALAFAVRRLSLLACVGGANRGTGGPVVAEAEINPLVVRPAGKGTVALDAVLVMMQPGEHA